MQFRMHINRQSGWIDLELLSIPFFNALGSH